jgi:hypothetical protein
MMNVCLESFNERKLLPMYNRFQLCKLRKVCANDVSPVLRTIIPCQGLMIYLININV